MCTPSLKEDSLKNLGHRSMGMNIFDRIYRYDFFSFSLEKNFENRIKDLEDYLFRLIETNVDHLFPILTPQDVLTLEDAKQRFKKSSLDILENMKNIFEEEKRVHLVPDSYLRQLIEETKQELFFSYNRFMQGLRATFIENEQRILPEGVEIKKVSNQIKTKLKPGKTKFPRRAREVLENWYKSHNDDPFPSYVEKQRLAEESGITVKQVKCWFINVRRKRWNKLKEDTDFKNQIEKKLLLNLNPTTNSQT